MLVEKTVGFPSVLAPARKITHNRAKTPQKFSSPGEIELPGVGGGVPAVVFGCFFCSLTPKSTARTFQH